MRLESEAGWCSEGRRSFCGSLRLVGAVLAASSAGPGPPAARLLASTRRSPPKQKHAERMLDKPGIAGIGVGLNPAGKPVIKIYKEKPQVADLPDELEDVAVESVTTGMLEPRDHTPRPVPASRADRCFGRPERHRDRDARRSRHRRRRTSMRSPTTTSSPAVNSANIGDGDHLSRAPSTEAAIRRIASARSPTIRRSTSTAGHEHHGCRHRADVDRERRHSTPADGYGAAEPDHGAGVHRAGGAEVRPDDGAPARERRRDERLGRRLLPAASSTRASRKRASSGRSPCHPGPFSAPGDSGSLIVTQGGNQPVGTAVCRRRRLDDRQSPIDLVLQRFGVTIDGAPPPEGPPAAPTAALRPRR